MITYVNQASVFTCVIWLNEQPPTGYTIQLYLIKSKIQDT